MMKKTKRIQKISTLVLLVALSACSSSLIVPTQKHVDSNSERYNDLTLAQLESGKEAYEAHCGKCHPLKDPRKWTADQWEKIVPNMSAKVNKKEDVLSPEKQEDILRYVIAVGG